LIRTQISEMNDGRKYFCIACTLHGTPQLPGQHAIQALAWAANRLRRELIYADGLVLDQPPVPSRHLPAVRPHRLRAAAFPPCTSHPGGGGRAPEQLYAHLATAGPGRRGK